MTSRFSAALRGRNPVRLADIWKSGLGAMIGVSMTGFFAHTLVNGEVSATPLLAAPIGASAVLAFAVPASPLAQPRAILGGNIISAIIGVTSALAFHQQPVLAAGVAVGAAIMAMSLLGCLHPPGGAVALGASLLATVPDSNPFVYVLTPIGVCSALLVVSAMAYARCAGRNYPHRVPLPLNAHATQDTPPLQRAGFTSGDIDNALAHYGELLDVDRADLDALFREVELQAHKRIHAHILCGDIMSRDVLTVDLHQTAESALTYMRNHDLRTAPVLDADHKVVGLVRRAELQANRAKLVEAALDPFVHKVRTFTPIERLLPILSSGAVHEAVVVDENRVLLGIITQTDLLGVLYRAHIVEAVAMQKAQQPDKSLAPPSGALPSSS